MWKNKCVQRYHMEAVGAARARWLGGRIQRLPHGNTRRSYRYDFSFFLFVGRSISLKLFISIWFFQFWNLSYFCFQFEKILFCHLTSILKVKQLIRSSTIFWMMFPKRSSRTTMPKTGQRFRIWRIVWRVRPAVMTMMICMALSTKAKYAHIYTPFLWFLQFQNHDLGFITWPGSICSSQVAPH